MTSVVVSRLNPPTFSTDSRTGDAVEASVERIRALNEQAIQAARTAGQRPLDAKPRWSSPIGWAYLPDRSPRTIATTTPPAERCAQAWGQGRSGRTPRAPLLRCS